MNRPPHEADIAEQLQHTINSGGAKFDYFSPDEKQRLSVYASAQHTGRDSYYGGGQDVNAYGATTDLPGSQDRSISIVLINAFYACRFYRRFGI